MCRSHVIPKIRGFGRAQLRCRRFLAAARNKLWWMTPEWGRAGCELPPETQFLLLELGTRGPYAVLLPLIDNAAFRATLRRRAPQALARRACSAHSSSYFVLRYREVATGGAVARQSRCMGGATQIRGNMRAELVWWYVHRSALGCLHGVLGGGTC